jgi:ATP adenylyltransferase
MTIPLWDNGAVTRPLWAPWRVSYVEQAGSGDDCVFCLEGDDALGAESLVIHRAETSLVLLNKFPYSSGHLMISPLRHVGELAELSGEEALELHSLTVRSLAALRAVSSPDGFNVGWNLGAVAGGSIAAHLHEHVVPRWSGDTNFMPVLADVKVVPEHLLAARDRLREAFTRA